MNALLPLPALADIHAFALALAVGATCLCAVVLALARLSHRRSEPFLYSILLGGVVGLLVLPALVGAGQGLRDTLAQLLPPPGEEIVKIPAEELPQLLNRPRQDVPEVEDEYAGRGEFAATVLVALWALGSALALSRLAYALWKQRRILVGPPWQAAMWTGSRQARLARSLGLRRFPAVHLSPAAPMPLVLGILRPRIILPAEAPEVWSEAQLEAILLHEAAHIARRDAWALVAQHLAVGLFWWCPLVYALSRRLSQLRESICDDYALAGPCDPIEYAEVLVQSAERLFNIRTCTVPLALLTSARGGLEARLTRLLKKEARPMTKLSLPGKLLGTVFLAAACVLTTAATALSGGQAPADKKVRIKIVVDGKEFDLGDVQLGQASDSGPKKGAVAITLDNIAIKEAPLDGGVALQLDAKDVVSGDKVIRFTNVVPVETRVLADTKDGVRFVAQAIVNQAAADPRIEELVKQAEAIKPGSGAQVRAALQGTSQAGEKGKTLNYRSLTVAPGTKAVWSVKPETPGGPVRLWQTTDGKKVIVLSIEDGNVIQLKDQDVKKFLEKGLHIQTREAAKSPGAGETKKPGKTVEVEFDTGARPKDTKVAPPRTNTETRGNEMEALRRQLERISAELQTLKQRLDAPTKR
jgi:beta-lactamase regulating signal transducer with metallopeptidase domain